MKRSESLHSSSAAIVVISVFSGNAHARWVSPDPLFLENPKKGSERPVDLNLYSYGSSNPVAFVDYDGLEPNKAQAASWEKARTAITGHFARHGKEPNLQGLRYTESDAGGGRQVGPFGGTSGPRYVWTERRGWVDLGHFFQVASVAQEKLGTGAKKVIAATVGRPFFNAHLHSQTCKIEDAQHGETRRSYEDPSSNMAGADFYLDYYDSDENLLGALDRFFQDAGAAAPESAPNWDLMQARPAKQRHFEEAPANMFPVLNPVPVGGDRSTMQP